MDIRDGTDGDDSIYGLGGNGNDAVHINCHDKPDDTVLDMVNEGILAIALTDAEGNPLPITDEVWDEKGNLIVPEGADGVITGVTGDKLTFTNMETLTTASPGA